MSDYEDKLTYSGLIKSLVNSIKEQDIEKEYEIMNRFEPEDVNFLYKDALNSTLLDNGITSSKLAEDPYIKNLGYDIQIRDLDPSKRVHGYYNRNKNRVVAPENMPDTLLHEIAHGEDNRSGFKGVGVGNVGNSELVPKTGIGAAQMRYSGHHQNSPMISKELLHNLIAGNKFYTASDTKDTSGSTDTLLKERLQQLKLGN